MQYSQTTGLTPREMILAKFGVCMQSSSTVLLLSDSTIAARPISAEAATHNERRLSLGPQIPSSRLIVACVCNSIRRAEARFCTDSASVPYRVGVWPKSLALRRTGQPLVADLEEAHVFCKASNHRTV